MKLLRYFGRWFYDDYGLTGFGFSVAVIAAIVLSCWGAWFFFLRGPSCDPPNHDVFTGTSTYYIKGIPYLENDYECVGP